MAQGSGKAKKTTAKRRSGALGEQKKGRAGSQAGGRLAGAAGAAMAAVRKSAAAQARTAGRVTKAAGEQVRRVVAESAGKVASAEAMEIVTDPRLSAKAAGLRYVTDAKPGIKRVRTGAKTFRYVSPEGKPVKDAETLGRIKSLVIPPAWESVWISPWPQGHLQATGRDQRGRKQSRYHPRWREARDETKYERMTLFAGALPKIREAVEHDLKMHGLPKRRVLAAIVSLMEATLIRVGNEEYAKENGSYGLTTMRHKHVEVHGQTITFEFLGKSKVHHTINLQDRRLAKIIHQCEELPGQELFQFVDHEGNRHTVDSHDVNEYLREISGEHFTAKDFRTWAGTVLASVTLQEYAPFSTAKEAKKNVVEAIKMVASRLGNTPSVCRKCYVHPAVLEAYLGGRSVTAAQRELDREIVRHTTALRAEEVALVELLENRKMLEAAAH